MATKKYKGYTIEAYREDFMVGWPVLYFSIIRDEDGFECVSDFEDSDERATDKIKQLKERIDNELKEDDPWGEKAELDEIYKNVCKNYK
jgi:hypothetical protein